MNTRADQLANEAMDKRVAHASSVDCPIPCLLRGHFDGGRSSEEAVSLGWVLGASHSHGAHGEPLWKDVATCSMPLQAGTTVAEAELRGAEQCALAALSVAIGGRVFFHTSGCVGCSCL
eukprot:TRINITY_DN13418_c0_g1_i1.p1 TRINITY_DN13418_c0_g1~~TRINITY_DN13418_c0_g1_i1.p1  ORF type:complete len:119 (-),score=8.83 TRINITY_DN13418_c0_g1_i1:56-412(-)